ncbi:MAG: 3-octaprenyl-4-hydroxybenzoate carboxy-lyase [Deltaproteobacteria bacterium RIFCSPLOWO2_02_FULL_57_26]|nr:MAG: 3-octaprenyl-4-hydroxybenzoate carboxy-lyase [Deltaproteobacteria bacterium RIFCSPLOWO2_02_FULL_57_26]OGQ79934.1 MAG: 3-octaprenyl-4-hydroxybenzoate carboxy-lyase [Deltaproteobacteria bacterium RIFCSPLOWO2_12_FULL_57_22]
MRRLIVGMSGATGAIYGIRILEVLSRLKDVETHLVLTRAAKMTIQVETPYSVRDVEEMASVVHDINNVGASISSGSFRTEGMVIAPCSMKSMGGIAHSIGGDLLVRAADVVLKERKRLVLVARETPLHLGHLENMVALTRIGAMIFPPVPAFYHRPKTLDDVINQTVTRILDQFGIEVTLFERWTEEGMSRHPEAVNPSSSPAGKKGGQAAKKQR